jgi:opacity protein-like surface antigen
MESFLGKVAIVSLFFFMMGHAHADEPQSNRPALQFGGFLGGGFVDWTGDDADGMSPGETAVAKPGGAVGLLMTLDLSRLLALDIEPFRLAIRPELVYATKGANFERNGEYRGAYVRMTYLQAALLLKADYTTAGRVTPYVVLGPELGGLYSAEVENGLGDVIDIKDDFKATDLGLILGLGAMYELPPYGSLGLELRGDLGLVSIDGQGDGDEIRNAALTLLLVYLY